jgi:hypothetical protein
MELVSYLVIYLTPSELSKLYSIEWGDDYEY